MTGDGTTLPVALTMGEPAGIGGEIALKAWMRLAEHQPAFFVIDDHIRLRALADGMGLKAPVAVISHAREAHRIFRHALPVLDIGSAVEAIPGIPSSTTAAAVVESISRAVSLVRSGEASAVCTNPIQKSARPAPGSASRAIRSSWPILRASNGR